MSIRREIIGLTDVLDVVANRLEEITGPDLTDAQRVVIQSKIEQLQTISEDLCATARGETILTNQTPNCERCNGTGEIGNCSRWPGCGCSERTKVTDCLEGTWPCPDCKGRAVKPVITQERKIPEFVKSGKGKGDQS